jgi:hypothetical protein
VVPVIEPSNKSNDISDVSSDFPFNTTEDNRLTSGQGKNSSMNEDTDIAGIFGDTVPVPMQVPGRSYDPDLKPWYYMET